MANGSISDRAAGGTGLGWPKRTRLGRLLGWPRVPRETSQPAAPPLAEEELEVDWSDHPNADDPKLAASDLATLVREEYSRDEQITDVDDFVDDEQSHNSELAPGGSQAQPTEPQVQPPAVPRETRRPHVAAMPKPAQTRVFVVANQKGGVGKTTTAVNIAAGLAMGGLSVLLIDLDPQGNASTALGIDHPPGTPGTYEVLIGNELMSDLARISPEAPTLSVVPATVDLAGAEIELVSVVARENRLNRALTRYLKETPTDYVFLDCPPSLGLLTLNALVAAGEILIPIQCEYYALEGVSQLMNTIGVVKGELNDELDLSTVLLTMYDARTRLAAQVAHEVRTHFAAQTLPGVIPRSVRISEAPSYGQTVLTYQPESTGARCYLDAAREIARRGAEEKS